MLAVGGRVGSLHVFDLARNLTRCYPREIESMRGFLDREARLQGTMSCNGGEVAGAAAAESDFASSIFSAENDDDGNLPDESQHEGLTKEEEAMYAEMENAFLNT